MPALLSLTARLAYTYDDKGNLSLVTVNEDVNKDGQFKLTQTIALEYGADKLPTKITVTSGNRNDVQQWIAYAYSHQWEGVCRRQSYIRYEYEGYWQWLRR